MTERNKKLLKAFERTIETVKEEDIARISTIAYGDKAIMVVDTPKNEDKEDVKKLFNSAKNGCISDINKLVDDERWKPDRNEFEMEMECEYCSDEIEDKANELANIIRDYFGIPRK